MNLDNPNLRTAEDWERRAVKIQERLSDMTIAIKRIQNMSSVRHTCKCGVPTGVGAIEMCASKALADDREKWRQK